MPAQTNIFANKHKQASYQARQEKMPSHKTCVRDDLDIMLQHESFLDMIELTARIRHRYQIIQEKTGQQYATKQKPRSNNLTVEETMRATTTLKMSQPDLPRNAIRRGEYPLTDAIIQDSLRILNRELKDLDKYITSLEETKPSLEEDSVNDKGSKKKEAIAIKYSKWQTDILMKWMVDHNEEPFPDPTAVAQLMAQTGLSQSQVVNWTTNVRKRNKKATCQGGKKPHHFIDFLFLVQEREKKQQQRVEQPSRKKQATPSSRRSVAMVSPSQSFASPPVQDAMMMEEDLFSIDNDPEMEDALMNEFANSWLKNQQQKQHQEQTEPMLVDDSVLLGDALDDFMAEHKHQQNTYQTTLMPSVTDDSAEQDAAVAVNRKRSRSIDLDDNEFDSEFEEWAESFDLNELDLEMMMDL